MARKVSKEDLRIKKEKIVQGVGGVSILQMEINIKTYHHFPEFVHKLHLIKSNSPLPAGNISPSTIRCLLLEILCLFTILPQRNVFSVRTQISMPHPYHSRILGVVLFPEAQLGGGRPGARPPLASERGGAPPPAE